MLMKNTIVALWILGFIASSTTLARNLRGGETTRMNYPANLQPDANVDTDDRKLDYSYNYYLTQTESNQYYRGNFK